MKKSFILMSLMLGALALTSCNNLDSTIEAPKGNFSFKVSTDTRAGIDNNNVVWQAGDSIAFGAIVSGSNDTMAVANAFAFAANDTFTGNIDLDESKVYDFYAVYPYVAAKNGGSFNMPNKTSYPNEYSNYLNVGSKAVNQSGESMDGVMKFAPMYGTATGKTPANLTIPMHHLAAILDFTVVNTMDSPVTIKSLQMTTPEGKNICGTYYVAIDGSISPSGSKYVYNTSTVTVSDGKSIAKGESFHVYMPIAPVTLDAASKVEFKITADAGECVISKTLSKAVTFAAGTISTQTLNFEGKKIADDYYTWDLTAASYASASADEISWTSDFATVINVKGTSQTPANNYIPTTRTSTRFYKNNVLTITPCNGYAIKTIDFSASTEGYATAFAGSTWGNANATVSGTTVTVTPIDGSTDITATVGGTCGFTNITVYYTEGATPAKALTGIAVSGQTTSFITGATFAFDGTCTATYEDGSTKVVTPASVSSPDMSTAGTQTVTVSYTENGVTKTAQYTITVTANVSTSGKYVLVTSNDQLTSGQYLIVCGSESVAFDGGLETLDAANNNVAVTIQNNSITATTSLKSAEFTYSSTDGSLKSASGKYIGNTANSNALSASDSPIANTVTISSDGDASIAGVAGAQLRYNATSGQYRFRYYKATSYANQKGISLYKYTE